MAKRQKAGPTRLRMWKIREHAAIPIWLSIE
jgi:hypothetical protein